MSCKQPKKFTNWHKNFSYIVMFIWIKNNIYCCINVYVYIDDVFSYILYSEQGSMA